MKSTPKEQLKGAVSAVSAASHLSGSIPDVRSLGDYIREQRNTSQISLRQLAKLAGVSNPYLSQIERGLRKPSAEILQQIAKALRISAEALYVQAGILEEREGDGLVVDALLADEGLTERQKQVLVEIYDSFRRENAAAAPAGGDDEAVAVTVVTTAGAAEPAGPAAAKPSTTRTASTTTQTRNDPTTRPGGTA
jgi:transcriptional regulator with XRE-family HTH domain